MIAIQPQFNTTNVELIDSTHHRSSHATITYVNQDIPSPYGMMSYENAIEQSSLSSVVMNQLLTPALNTDMTPDYIGKRVAAYNKLVEFTDALYLQRKYLSRAETMFQFVNEDHQNSAKTVINVLSQNRKR